MKLLVKSAAALLLLVGGLAGMFWIAALWWEKAFATRVSAQISPDGCYHLEQ